MPTPARWGSSPVSSAARVGEHIGVDVEVGVAQPSAASRRCSGWGSRSRSSRGRRSRGRRASSTTMLGRRRERLGRGGHHGLDSRTCARPFPASPQRDRRHLQRPSRAVTGRLGSCRTAAQSTAIRASMTTEARIFITSALTRSTIGRSVWAAPSPNPVDNTRSEDGSSVDLQSVRHADAGSGGSMAKRGIGCGDCSSPPKVIIRDPAGR